MPAAGDHPLDATGSVSPLLKPGGVTPPHRPRWFGWSIRVRDDRAVEFTARGIPESIWWSPRHPLAKCARERVRGLGLRSPGVIIVQGMLVLGWVAGMFIAIGYAVRMRYPLAASLVLIGGGGIGVLALIHRLTVMRWAAEETLDQMRLAALGDGRCIACGYAIRSIKPDDDGCRVCSECGAAWRLLP